MKTILNVLIPFCVFIGCIIGDIFIGKWLFSLVPIVAWSGLIKVGISILLLWLTAGFIFLVVFFYHNFGYLYI